MFDLNFQNKFFLMPNNILTFLKKKHQKFNIFLKINKYEIALGCYQLHYNLG